MKLDYYSISAAISLRLASFEYDIANFGLGAVQSVQELLKNFPGGDLGAETFIDINTHFLSGVETIIRESRDITPVWLPFDRESGRFDLNITIRSIIYGIKSVAKGLTLDESQSVAPKNVLSELVDQAYRKISGAQLPSNSSPAPDAIRRAKRWLTTGPGFFVTAHPLLR